MKDGISLFVQQCVIQHLYNISLRIGLKTNIFKTRITANFESIVNSSIMLDNQKLHMTDKYVYLEHILSFGKEYQKKEISRRIQLGWVAINKLHDMLKYDTVPQCLKTRLYNRCVLLVITYTEMWILTKETLYRMPVAQRAMSAPSLV